MFCCFRHQPALWELYSSNDDCHILTGSLLSISHMGSFCGGAVASWKSLYIACRKSQVQSLPRQLKGLGCRSYKRSFPETLESCCQWEQKVLPLIDWRSDSVSFVCAFLTHETFKRSSSLLLFFLTGSSSTTATSAAAMAVLRTCSETASTRAIMISQKRWDQASLLSQWRTTLGICLYAKDTCARVRGCGHQCNLSLARTGPAQWAILSLWLGKNAEFWHSLEAFRLVQAVPMTFPLVLYIFLHPVERKLESSFLLQVTYLEKKVTELENDSMTNGDLKSKLKQENTQLVHR